ncbi:cation diffusion facilitator family transporter [Martelella endophytica]|uniref:Cobalt transporter n=1 Tax=Martelella endophytica TaxID=1486262 RepID=A0A0D5LNQ0_MAREN|nr:cation diffusion facilitator family transporter [Martelella endophytica]AJY45575.1 cobalt transporter [Martelella endophytica]
MADHHHGSHDHGGHDHSAHAHGAHGHSHAPANFGRAFAIGISLNIVYVVLEAIFGVMSGSLALIADAGHNLSDVFGLLIAWGAMWLAAKPPTSVRTYGFKRAPILASLANAIILLIAVGAISWEAIGRFFQPEPIASVTVIWVAAAGVLVNGFTAWLFASGSKDDLNIRGAFLHMAIDALVTIGVIFAALLIMWTGFDWIDPAVSLIISAVILIGTWGLLRDSVMMAIDAVPSGIDITAVRKHLESADGVEEVHDLHIWALSTTETALTAHLVCRNTDPKHLLASLPEELKHDFGIGHTTLQIETAEAAENCHLRPSHVV